MQKMKIGPMGSRRACIFAFGGYVLTAHIHLEWNFGGNIGIQCARSSTASTRYLCIRLASILCIPCQPLRATRLSITNANVFYLALYIGNSKRYQISPKILLKKNEVLTVADSGFPRQGRQPLSLGQKPIIWQDFCQKLHKNERNWNGGGGARP